MLLTKFSDESSVDRYNSVAYDNNHKTQLAHRECQIFPKFCLYMLSARIPFKIALYMYNSYFRSVLTRFVTPLCCIFDIPSVPFL